MSAFIFSPSTNRCPSLRGKPPWSLWLNQCLKFTARLRDLTDNGMCEVQRLGSHPYNVLYDLVSKCLLLNLFRLAIKKVVEFLFTEDISAFPF